MRAYLALTPKELSELLESKSRQFSTAFILTPTFMEQNSELDEEECEFELSLLAAKASRAKQGLAATPGYVLAADLENRQVGRSIGDEVELLTEVLWSQVESVLVAESEEPELTWYANQEVATYLPQWLA